MHPLCLLIGLRVVGKGQRNPSAQQLPKCSPKLQGKLGSWSCSTTCRTPKLCIMWSKSTCAKDNVESSPSPITMEISLTHLVSLSTTVNMQLNNLLSGRSVIESMDHTKKCSAGLSIGYNKPAGVKVKSLCSWQTQHLCTNAETSCNKPGHQTLRNREDKVLWIPKCPPSVQCISYNKS